MEGNLEQSRQAGRVLITGAFGYLGGRIARDLAAASKFHLRLASRQTRPATPWLHEGEVVQMDVLSEAQVESACLGVQSILHLAALNEHQCAADPERAVLVNTLGSLRLLRAAERAGVDRFLFLSTAHVYGSPLEGEITEATLTRPVHPYAITHRAAEEFVLAAHDRCALTGIVVRLSNGLGAPADPTGDRWTLIANDLCRQAVSSRALLLRTSGLQRRDFITMSDITRAVRHLLALPSSACGDGVFNLGGENPMRILDMAELIAERGAHVLGYRPRVEHPEPAPGERSQELSYSIQKLRATGFELAGDMAGEIDETLRVCERAFKGAGQ